MQLIIFVLTNKAIIRRNSKWRLRLLPLHDQKVDLRSGEVQEPDTGCVETYQVEVIDGDVYVCL